MYFNFTPVLFMDVFNTLSLLIKEINGLRKEINILLSKRISNVKS